MKKTQEHLLDFPKMSHLNLSLIKYLDPAANLEEMQRTEECVKMYHENSVTNIETVGNSMFNEPEC